MNDYDTNVYYNPQKHGLTVMAEFEYSDGNYQFDTRVIWRHDLTGLFYTARDSGCSCPTPFENYNSVADLAPFVLSEIEAELREESTGDYKDVTPQQAGEWLDALRVALRTPYVNPDY